MKIFYLLVLLFIFSPICVYTEDEEIYVTKWNRLTQKKCNELCNKKLVGVICGIWISNCCIGKGSCTADGLGWSCDGPMYQLKCGTKTEWFN
jgi:hypothetical protein